MPLTIFEDALQPVRAGQRKEDFDALLRNCREALGVKQYRAAEFIGITHGRLKNLESGYFRDMPSNSELIALSRLYDLNINLLQLKAREHCEERCRRRKERN